MTDNETMFKLLQHPPVSDKAGKLSEDIQNFGEFLFGLSARLMDVSPSEMHTLIESALKIVGEYWKFDRMIQAELSAEGTEARVNYSYSAPGVTQHYPTILLNKIPALKQNIRKGITVSLLPSEGKETTGATKEEDFIGNEPIRPGLFIPIKKNEIVCGLLIVNSMTMKTWSRELIEQLQNFGKIIIGTLDRWKTEEKVREVEHFERLLSEISAKYINLPVKKLENVLKNDFAQLNKALGVDASVLYVAVEDTQTFREAKALIWYLDESLESNRRMAKWLKKNPIIHSDHFADLFEKWNRGEATHWQVKDNVPEEELDERQFAKDRNVKSTLGVPIRFAGSVKGVINIMTTRTHQLFTENLNARLRLLGEVFINALMRKNSEEKLQNALTEIKALKKRIEADYIYLREEVDFELEYNFGGIVGKSNILRKILSQVKQVAPTQSSVLLLGETGTGKGLIARAIHNESGRRDRPLMQMNCTALAPGLIESELFGHEKGAFTGASQLRIGRFEAAMGTTLFLDEIGELPLEQQPKLLRILEEGEFERIGGSKTRHTDARLIAATSRDLKKDVEDGRFRRDLWYRLNIFPIFIPPLRSRVEDIPLFVAYFVEKFGKWARKSFHTVPMETIKALQRYHWPGNIRELRNLIERAVITSPDGQLQIEIPSADSQLHDDKENIKDAAVRTWNKRKQIYRALEKSNWVVEGPKGAALLLGMSGGNVRYYMRRFDIKRPI